MGYPARSASGRVSSCSPQAGMLQWDRSALLRICSLTAENSFKSTTGHSTNAQSPGSDASPLGVPITPLTWDRAADKAKSHSAKGSFPRSSWGQV